MAPLKFIAVSLLQSVYILQAYAHPNVEPSPPQITEGPSFDYRLEARQNNQVICSQWSLVLGGQPACGLGLTCIFENGGFYEGCYDSTTDLTFQTECFNYPTTWDGQGTEPVSTFYCPSSAPYCGSYLFIDYASDTYTNLGCSSSPYTQIATQIEQFTDGASPSSTASFAGASSTDFFILTGATISTISTFANPVSTSAAASSSTSQAIIPIIHTSPTTSSQPQTTSASPTPAPATNNNAAVIGGAVGGSIGGIALILGGVLLFCCVKRRNDRGIDSSKEPGISTAPAGPAMGYAPPAQQYEPVPQFSQTPKYDGGAFQGGQQQGFAPEQHQQQFAGSPEMGAPQRASAGWNNNPNC